MVIMFLNLKYLDSPWDEFLAWQSDGIRLWWDGEKGSRDDLRYLWLEKDTACTWCLGHQGIK